MANPQSPGITSQERQAAIVDIPSAPTSVGALIVTAERGPINTPVLISSEAQYRRIFGGPISTSYGYESVSGFFSNGGSSIWIVRVAHYTDITNAATLTAVKASTTLQTIAATATAGARSSSAETFDLEPGEQLDLAIDGGGTQSFVFAATAGSKTSGNSAPFALTNGNTLIVSVDGGPDQTVTFVTADFSAIGAATALEVAYVLNRDLVGCQALIAGSDVILRSDVRGTGSSIEITGGTDAAAFAFPAGATAGTGDVANIDAVTAAEVVSKLSTLTGATAAAAAGVVTVTSGTTGASSTVAVVGSTTATNLGFTGTGTGSATSATNALTLTAASEGAFGNNYRVTSTRTELLATTTAAAITVSVALSTLNLTSTTRLRVGDTVRFDDGANIERAVVSNINGTAIEFASFTPAATLASGSNVYVEHFTLAFFESGEQIVQYTELRSSSLAGIRWVENVINSTDNPEVFFDADDLALTPSPSVDPRPSNVAAPGQAFASGVDGGGVVDSDYVGSAASALGLYALSTTVINMISIPGQTTATVHGGIETFVNLRKTVMGIIEVPQGTATAAAAVTYVQTTANLAHDNLAIYSPWITINDPLTNLPTEFPPSGFIQGLFAGVERRRNIAKAPAGAKDGKFQGTRDVEKQWVETADTDILYPAKINPILAKPEGILVFGSRTLGLADELRQVAKRRVMNYAISSIESGTRFILFEDNEPETRARFRKSVQAFLLQMWRNKLLAGASASEAFFVICDESNNPPSVENAGKFYARIGLRFKNTIEFAIYEFEQDLRALQAELAAAGLS